jgi:hypothetical protein
VGTACIQKKFSKIKPTLFSQPNPPKFIIMSPISRHIRLCSSMLRSCLHDTQLLLWMMLGDYVILDVNVPYSCLPLDAMLAAPCTLFARLLTRHLICPRSFNQCTVVTCTYNIHTTKRVHSIAHIR